LWVYKDINILVEQKLDIFIGNCGYCFRGEVRSVVVSRKT
jgi:hypothetical protein